MSAVVVVGGFFGDEGKGKFVSHMALRDGYAAAARGGVGPNAGHTVVVNGVSYKLRMLPSAVISKDVRLMIGAGVLVDPRVFLDEVNRFACGSRTVIDEQCALIESIHTDRDSTGHLKEKIGTTGTGTGPAQADRVLRTARLARDSEALGGYLGNVSVILNDLMDSGNDVLVEGTQGTFLSLYHGTYPFVTSKDVTASAVCADVGIGPKRVVEVIVVFKSYLTRVGGGPLEGEVDEVTAAERGWREVATVTGRVRRAAPFSIQLAKKACRLNGATQIAISKLDVLYPQCKGVRIYERLPEEAKAFISRVEDETGVRATLIGTGPETDEIIDRRHERKG